MLDLKQAESIKLKGYVEEQDKIPDKGETVSTIKYPGLRCRSCKGSGLISDSRRSDE
ncbi:hypothetical protein [Paenibacillus sp. FSL R7-0273]|uniref:hypothetical protein n=1 Tax=Paenibacillus sp. FSL R7-0273 TaxID=1536772 RepID=UPI000ADB6A2A|nr:hypothetical protein [Paenibacillus sp. FSL R7-0273]